MITVLWILLFVMIYKVLTLEKDYIEYDPFEILQLDPVSPLKISVCTAYLGSYTYSSIIIVEFVQLLEYTEKPLEGKLKERYQVGHQSIFVGLYYKPHQRRTGVLREILCHSSTVW